MIQVEYLQPHARERLGYIPQFLDKSDVRPAKEQFNEHYAHGGGWSPMNGWSFDPTSLRIKYSQDPSMLPIARMTLPKTKEIIYVYPNAWVLIVDSNASWEIARLD
jgi:hypothetical protein